MTEKDLRTVLSKNLKRYRNQRNFTQAEFAKEIDVSIPFLSDIENGKKWVSPATLTKITHALDISAYELFKPEGVLPDNAVHIVEKFSADIYSAFGEALNSLCADYVSSLATSK